MYKRKNGLKKFKDSRDSAGTLRIQEIQLALRIQVNTDSSYLNYFFPSGTFPTGKSSRKSSSFFGTNCAILPAFSMEPVCYSIALYQVVFQRKSTKSLENDLVQCYRVKEFLLDSPVGKVLDGKK